jgi:hypothetical protein
MKCRFCNNDFYIRRELHKLFSNKKLYICDSCYNRYKIDLDVLEFPLDDYHCVILSMFRKNYYIDYEFFIDEYSKIFSSIILRNGYIVLFFDIFTLNDYTIEMLDIYSKLLEKNIYVLCFHLRN